jgi:hypothetical protein
LVLLALFQILSPLSSVAVNCGLLGVGPTDYLAALFTQPWLQIFDFLFLMPVAGIAIYAMKRWSYPVFLAALAWSGYANFTQYATHPTMIPVGALIFVYAVNLSLVAYFLIPAVRATYMDPGVRWWEAKPRYFADIAAQYQPAVDGPWVDARIGNLSETGIYLEIARPTIPVPHVNDSIRLRFQILGQDFFVTGQIIYISTSRTLWSCGMRLEHSRATRADFGRLTRALESLLVPREPQRIPHLRGLNSWIRLALQTGEGWVPRLPASHPAVWRPAKVSKLPEAKARTESQGSAEAA